MAPRIVMSVNRLYGVSGIGVDRVADLADTVADPYVLRLENLDTDLRPPAEVVELTQSAAERDSANSYIPFLGSVELRRAAAALVSRLSGVDYDWKETTQICAGGLNGILNVLLALVEPGDEVVMPDPIYIGLINRVRLAGGTPVFVPYRILEGRWVLDRKQLAKAVSSRTKVILMMSPSMPTGAVLSRGTWETVCRACRDAGAWLLYDAAMERILFEGLEHVHPASFPGMQERTITVGSVSKEYRMIGWRVGWIVAPPSIANDIALVNVSNVVSPVGIAQEAAAAALRTPDSDIAAAVASWSRRRDLMLQELEGLPVVRPQGGWSLLMDVSGFGMSSAEASERLLALGKVAATPMEGWGSHGAGNYIRFVFSNERVHRLLGLRERITISLGLNQNPAE